MGSAGPPRKGTCSERPIKGSERPKNGSEKGKERQEERSFHMWRAILGQSYTATLHWSRWRGEWHTQ